MQSLADLNNTLLDRLDPQLAASARASRIREAFAQAMMDAAGTEEAARYMLSHVQAVYVMRDDQPRRADGRPSPVLLRIYSDDSAVRAEIDARQEWIRMSLARQGIHYDRMKIHASSFGMKERHPFDRFLRGENGAMAPDVERHTLTMASMDELADRVSLAPLARAMRNALEATSADAAHTASENGRSNKLSEKERRIMVERLETLKRAFCLTFGSGADDVLARINAAYLPPTPQRDERRRERWESCRAILYSSDPRMHTVMRAYGDQVRDNARHLGLYIRGPIRVADSPASIIGCQAFPAMAAPVIVQFPESLAERVL